MLSNMILVVGFACLLANVNSEAHFLGFIFIAFIGMLLKVKDL